MIASGTPDNRSKGDDKPPQPKSSPPKSPSQHQHQQPVHSPMIPVADELTTAGISHFQSLPLDYLSYRLNKDGNVDSMDVEVSADTSRLDDDLGQAESRAQGETRDSVPSERTKQPLWEELQEHAMDAMKAFQYNQAEELFRYILHLQNEQEEDDEKIITTLANIGKCCELTGRLEESMSCFKEALLVKQNKDLRNEPTSVQLLMADILYEIGMIHCQMCMEASSDDGSLSDEDNQSGKGSLAYSKAMKAFTMSLKLRTTCLGSDHPTVSNTEFSIANLLTESGRPANALDFHNKALLTRRNVLGSQHPEVASSLRHLAIAYSALGQYEAAERVLLEALEILKRVPFDGSIQEVMIELSKVRRKMS